jgi:hypothetical protein
MLAIERTATGRFPPDRSGNPAGRPVGSRNKSTLAAEAALAARAEEVVEAVVGAAMAGKPAAMRICFDRLAPLRKGRPVRFALPRITSAADVVGAAGTIVAGMADGELTPAEAQDMLKALEAFQRVTSPARRARQAAAEAGPDPQPWAAAETCKSPEPAAAAGAENVALDRVSTAPAPPDRADAERPRQPKTSATTAPVETSKSPGFAAAPSGENVEVLDQMPIAPTPADPARSADALACRQPKAAATTAPVETRTSPAAAVGAGSQYAGQSAAPKPAADHALAARARHAGSHRHLQKPANHPDLQVGTVEKMPGAAVRNLAAGASLAAMAAATASIHAVPA